jgi:UDP-N-acetylglucosamine--N-acetylmuramyl-(pentapeptide) pyrophosphoryl-undecaprenol N-acetylglucosamine transferase
MGMNDMIFAFSCFCFIWLAYIWESAYFCDMNICVACGGTGGHIFPGLAAANELRLRGHEVTLCLGGRDVEAVSVDGWDGKLIALRAVRLEVSLRNFLSLLRLPLVVLSAAGQLRRIKPDAVLAMGSYTSVAPVLAARLCRIPVVLHEANAVPGKAVSMLARFAKYIGIAFPEAAEHLPGGKTVCCGFPLRREI